MSEHECNGTGCTVHSRTDGIKHYSDGTGLAAKVTYVGDYVVITQINDLLRHPSATLLRALGAPADMYHTEVIRVGEGSLGDWVDGDQGDSSFYDDVKYMVTHTEDRLLTTREEQEKHAENFHDGVVDAVKADTIDLSQGITSDDWSNIMKNSLKPLPKGNELGDLFG